MSKEIREPATVEQIMQGNKYAKYTTGELHELFNQLRFFWTNGYCQKDSELEKLRKQYSEETPYCIIRMEKDLLYAIAVDHFMKEEKEACIDIIHQEQET